MKLEITNAFGTYTVEIEVTDMGNGREKYRTVTCIHTDPNQSALHLGGISAIGETLKNIKKSVRRYLINPTFKVLA